MKNLSSLKSSLKAHTKLTESSPGGVTVSSFWGHLISSLCAHKMSSQWACCELSVSLVSHTVSFLWSFCEFANCTQARHKRFSHLELFSQTSNNCSLKTVMLCLMFANIYEQWTTMLRKLCSGWGSPCEHGVSFLWLCILQQYDISLLHKPVARYVIEWGGVCFSHKSGLFFVLFGRNWNLCAYYGKKYTFLHYWRKLTFLRIDRIVRVNFPGKIFLKNMIENYAFRYIMI